MTAIMQRESSALQPSADSALLGLDRDVVRFEKYVQVQESGCHHWTGGKAGRGYGVFTVGFKSDKTQRLIYAHRWAFVRHSGAIPDGLTIDHLCNNPQCVNPAHLVLATAYDNSMRGSNPAALNKRKTHCPAGHEYDQKNTHIDKTGSRHCRICDRLRHYARFQVEKGRAA